MKNICSILLLFLFSICQMSAQQSGGDVYKDIIHNIVQQEISNANLETLDSKTEGYLKILNADGSFQDIDYSSRSQTMWRPGNHVGRLREMCLAYIHPESKYYGNEDLYKTLVAMVNCWYDKNPTSTNWFYHEISWPQAMGLSLTLMRVGKQQMPKELESKMLKRMRDISRGPNQGGSQGTGANKMDIALQWIYRNVLQENADELKFSIDQFYYPIQYNSGQGIQQDYSYLQHGMQLYTAGYGGSVLTAFFKVAFYLKGTAFERPEKTEIISKFVRYGYLPNIRGSVTMYNIKGRGIAGSHESGGVNGFHGHIQKLKMLDPANSTTYDEAIKRLKKEEGPSYQIKPYHRHYWRADHSIHQQPGYNMDVRLVSNRTLRCENGNGANLKGYFLAEGGTEIVRRGDEYLNIFPVWDWARIPGTTTPAMSTIPNPGTWGTPGQTPFAGGVSDEVYGVTAYDMMNTERGVNTFARKSWFFFDKEVVCMGAGIHSTNGANINTTVNQCLLNGNVKVTNDKGAEFVQPKGEKSYTDVRWVTHDSISYYFPNGGNLKIRNAEQKGIPYDISHDLGHVEEKADVFKMWFDHGVRPTKGDYMYYVMPNVLSAEEGKKVMDDMLTVNSDTIQAVYNRSLNTIGAVFYKEGILNIGGMEINSKTPCVVMFKDVNTADVKTYVSDPTQKLDSTLMYVKFPQFKKHKMLSCKYDKRQNFAGSTLPMTVNAQTPDSVWADVEDFSFAEPVVNLGYDKVFDRVKVQVTPANAVVGKITYSIDNEEVAIVDQEGIVRAMASGVATLTAKAANGPKTTCQIKVADGVCVAEAIADAEVWSGGANNNYGANKNIVARFEPNNDRRVYVRFPMKFPEGFDQHGVEVKAKVYFYSQMTQKGCSSVNWTIHPVVSSNWDEMKITWNNKPATGQPESKKQGLPEASVDGKPFDFTRMVDFNVDNSVAVACAANKDNFSVMLYQDKRAVGAKGWSTFASRENDIRIKHPIVVFTFEEKASEEILAEVANLIKFENCVGSYSSEQLKDVKAAYNNGKPSDIKVLTAALAKLKEGAPIALISGKAFELTNSNGEKFYVATSAEGMQVKCGKMATDAADKAGYQWLLLQQSGNTYLYNVGADKFLYLTENKGENVAGVSLSDIPHAVSVSKVDPMDLANLYLQTSVAGGDINKNIFLYGGGQDGAVGCGQKGNALATQTYVDVTAKVAQLDSLNKAISHKLELLTVAAEWLSYENIVGGYSSAQLADVKKLYNNGAPEDVNAFVAAADALLKQPALKVEGYRVYTFYNREWPTYTVYANESDMKIYNYKYDAAHAANAQWLVCAVEGGNYLYNIATKKFMHTEDHQWTLKDDKSNFDFDVANPTNPYFYCVGPYGDMDDKANDKHFMHSQKENGIITGWRGSITKSQYTLMDVTLNVQDLETIVKDVKRLLLQSSKGAAYSQLEAIHNSYKVDVNTPYMGYGMTSDSAAYSDAKKAIDAAYETDQMTAAIAAYQQFLNENKRMPEAGKYYVIESAFKFADKGTKAIYESYDGEKHYAMWKNVDSCGVDYLWQIIPNENGKYTIASANTGKFMTGVKYGEAIYTEAAANMTQNYAYTLHQTDSVATFEFRNWFAAKDYATITAYNAAGKAANAADSEGPALKSWKSNDCAIFWKIREVEEIAIAMDSAEYVGVNYPFAVDVTAAVAAGAKIYTISDQTANYATLQEVTGSLIAAQTPFIVAGEQSKQYVVAISDEAGETVTDNRLQGTLAATAVKDNVYTMGVREGVSAFYKADALQKLAKNSVYLVSDADNQNEVIAVGPALPDGIVDVENQQDADHIWYTLGGIRVAKPTKGIFVNGKGKVVLFK